MRATFPADICAPVRASVLRLLPFLLLLAGCTQDQNASNSGRDTHMGAAGEMASQAPALPAAANPPPPPTEPAPAPPAPAAASDGGTDGAAKAGDAGAADAGPTKKRH